MRANLPKAIFFWLLQSTSRPFLTTKILLIRFAMEFMQCFAWLGLCLQLIKVNLLEGYIITSNTFKKFNEALVVKKVDFKYWYQLFDAAGWNDKRAVLLYRNVAHCPQFICLKRDFKMFVQRYYFRHIIHTIHCVHQNLNVWKRCWID